MTVLKGNKTKARPKEHEETLKMCLVKITIFLFNCHMGRFAYATRFNFPNLIFLINDFNTFPETQIEMF
jgi:hypothetical protein